MFINIQRPVAMGRVAQPQASGNPEGEMTMALSEVTVCAPLPSKSAMAISLFAPVSRLKAILVALRPCVRAPQENHPRTDVPAVAPKRRNSFVDEVILPTASCARPVTDCRSLPLNKYLDSSLVPKAKP